MKAGGTNVDLANSITTDSSGNSYVTGCFSTAITIGSTTLTSSGDHDVFVAKASPAGTWLWAKKAGGTRADVGVAIDTDAAGNVYLSGRFNSGTIYFGSLSIARTSSRIDNDIFVAKLDNSGNWLWAKGLGATSTDEGTGIALDANSNIYISGTFRNTLSVPTVPPTSLASAGYSDVLVAKLDSGGNWLWAKKASGTSYDNSTGIAVDSSGNVYACGAFPSSTFTLGTIVLANPSGFMEAWIAKLDTNGNWLWADNAGGTGSDSPSGLTIDGAGNAVMTGSYEGTAYFGNLSITYNDYFDVFVSKIDPSGNWLWAKTAGGNQLDTGWGIATDSASNVYLTGQFASSAQFGNTTLTNPSASLPDAFVAKMNSAGTWQSAYRIGGTGSDIGRSVAIDNGNNILPIGEFESSITIGSSNLSASGLSDVYVAKLAISTPLQLTSPNGGEQWYVNTPHPITWTANNVNSVFLDYSLNNGSSWTQINSAPLSADLGTYSWTVPGTTSSQALVRIRNYENASVFDVSDAVFSILAPASPPQANFVANLTSGYEPLTVQFTDQSQPVSGTLATWAWTFGDGGTSSLQNPQHTYQNDGVYSVSLTVTNSFGLSGNLVRHNYITVLPTVPTIQLLSAPNMDFGSVNVGSLSAYQNVSLQNSGNANLLISEVHFQGAPLNFQYQLGTPPFTVAPGATFSIPVRFTPQTAGALSDILYIVNNSSNLSVLQVALSGTGVELVYPPQANFTADVTSGAPPLSVQFTDASLPVSGTITSWAWDFGDNHTSSQQNPQHNYNNPGIYTVSLTVTNSAQLSNTLTRNNYISVIAPVGTINLLSGSLMNLGTVFVGNSSEYLPVRLSNSGTETVNITDIHFNADPCQFSYVVSGEALLLEPGETDSIFVRFTPLDEGTWSDNLYIANDSDNTPLLTISLSGIGVVPPPEPPENVAVYLAGDDARLTWGVVATDVTGQTIDVDYYAVFANGTSDPTSGYTYHGLTQEENYVHAYVTMFAPQMYYQIYAIDIYRGDDPNEALVQEIGQYLQHNLDPGMTYAEFSRVVEQATQTFRGRF